MLFYFYVCEFYSYLFCVDVYTWRKDLTFKTNLIQKYLSDLGFPSCVKQILNLVEIYCETSLHQYNQETEDNDEDDEEDEGKASPFENGDVLNVIVDETLFALLEDPSFKAIQELRLLEILCTYFGAEGLNSLKYLVFDCLFGNVSQGESYIVFKVRQGLLFSLRSCSTFIKIDSF